MQKSMTQLVQRIASDYGGELAPIVERRTTGRMLAFRTRPVKVGGEQRDVDAQQLMRMIRRITQTIGEYKATDNTYAAYVVPSLRKCRGDMVNDLEDHFGIHFEITDDGKTVFYV